VLVLVYCISLITQPYWTESSSYYKKVADINEATLVSETTVNRMHIMSTPANRKRQMNRKYVSTLIT